jgi:hypothetical protein
MMKRSKQNVVAMSGFILLDIIIARWQCPVASSEALDLLHLHQAMRAVTYRHIAMAIEMAIFTRVFVDCCLFACCPGGRWGNTEGVVSRWRLPGASSVALDLLHWVMPRSSLQRIRIAIEMAYDGGTFILHHPFYHQQ